MDSFHLSLLEVQCFASKSLGLRKLKGSTLLRGEGSPKQAFTHLVNSYYVLTYCAPGTVLGTGDTAVNNNRYYYSPSGVYILVGKRDNKLDE